MEAVMMNVHAVLPAKGTTPNMHLYVAVGVGQEKASSLLLKFVFFSTICYTLQLIFSEVEASRS